MCLLEVLYSVVQVPSRRGAYGRRLAGSTTLVFDRADVVLKCVSLEHLDSEDFRHGSWFDDSIHPCIFGLRRERSRGGWGGGGTGK